MRFEYFLISVLLLTACGGRSMNQHLARDLIMEIPEETLEKEDIEVVTLTQVSGSEAIAETTLKTAFRLEKVQGQMGSSRGPRWAWSVGKGEQSCSNT